MCGSPFAIEGDHIHMGITGHCGGLQGDNIVDNIGVDLLVRRG